MVDAGTKGRRPERRRYKEISQNHESVWMPSTDSWEKNEYPVNKKEISRRQEGPVSLRMGLLCSEGKTCSEAPSPGNCLRKMEIQCFNK